MLSWSENKDLPNGIILCEQLYAQRRPGEWEGERWRFSGADVAGGCKSIIWRAVAYHNNIIVIIDAALWLYSRGTLHYSEDVMGSNYSWCELELLLHRPCMQTPCELSPAACHHVQFSLSNDRTIILNLNRVFSFRRVRSISTATYWIIADIENNDHRPACTYILHIYARTLYWTHTNICKSYDPALELR